MFLPGLLPHTDAVGVGVAGGGPCCHGAVACGVVGYRARIGQVSQPSLQAGHSASRYRCSAFNSTFEVIMNSMEYVFWVSAPTNVLFKGLCC